jgi:DNA-binding NarL/FixJ family response regulator
MDMSTVERHRVRSQKVVETFKASLDEYVMKMIPDSEFEELALMIQEAISDELHNAAELVENVAQQIRSESDLPELGL